MPSGTHPIRTEDMKRPCAGDNPGRKIGRGPCRLQQNKRPVDRNDQDGLASPCPLRAPSTYSQPIAICSR